MEKEGAGDVAAENNQRIVGGGRSMENGGGKRGEKGGGKVGKKSTGFDQGKEELGEQTEEG